MTKHRFTAIISLNQRERETIVRFTLDAYRGMTVQAIKDPALSAFEAAIRERLGEHLKKIILFGSRARGDNDPESDYDILLVVDEVTPDVKRISLDVSGECFCEYSRLFPAIPISEERFKNDLYEPFLINARREGISF
ncbi:nucleotidyltransferase domain-containing protein [bacterium]|nr:nucleotidyltransferase domain-containing protein [bacterium]